MSNRPRQLSASMRVWPNASFFVGAPYTTSTPRAFISSTSGPGPGAISTGATNAGSKEGSSARRCASAPVLPAVAMTCATRIGAGMSAPHRAQHRVVGRGHLLRAALGAPPSGLLAVDPDVAVGVVHRGLHRGGEPRRREVVRLGAVDVPADVVRVEVQPDPEADRERAHVAV